MRDSPQRPKTHYEILRVEPGVSADDLKAAHRVLSRRFHPDRHPRHAEAAARIMACVNVARDVLSDPERRAAYDREIGVRHGRAPARRYNRVRHGRTAAVAGRRSEPVPVPVTGLQANMASDPSMRRRMMAVRRLMAASVLFCVAALLVIVWIVAAPSEEEGASELSRIFDALVARASPAAARPPAEKPEVRSQAVRGFDMGSVHIRPLESPAGLQWPARSGELAGFARLFATGDNGLLLDNRLGPSDVFAKVYRLEDAVPLAARHAFLRAHERLLLQGFPPGTYEVRYLSLDTGQTLRSVPLVLAPSMAEDPPLEFRLDDMQGRSGRAAPITREAFHSTGLDLKPAHQLSTDAALQR